MSLSLYPVRELYRRAARRAEILLAITSLVALFVCLAPTTIGALLSAIGIAGMSRLNQANVLAMSGRAVEAAGDVDVLLLDKTGTITLGNRQAAAFMPGGRRRASGNWPMPAQLASLADETPEGRSIVVLAKERFGIRGRELADPACEFIPVYGADAHERCGLRAATRSARGRPMPSRLMWKCTAGAVQRAGGAVVGEVSRTGRHAAGCCARSAVFWASSI